jgi:hypothetical protein
MYLSASGIVVACDRSCFCVFVESGWSVIGHGVECLFKRCGLWSDPNFCGYHRPQRFNNHTNTCPFTDHNDSISTQIHDRSQATTIPLAHKNMTDHCPQRLNRCGQWSVMFLCASGIVLACDRSCICVIVESLWPVLGHDTWPIIGHNDSTITQIHASSQTTMIPLAHKYMTVHRPQRFH